MRTAHDLYYDQDRWYQADTPPDGPDEPPMKRVGTCSHCGHGVWAWVIDTPDPYDPEAFDTREVVEPCDCVDLEDHDDPEPPPMTDTDDPAIRHAEQKRAWDERNAERRSFDLRARRRALAWLRETNQSIFDALYAAEPTAKPDGTPIHRYRRWQRACAALVKCVPEREWLLLYERAKREQADEEGVEL